MIVSKQLFTYFHERIPAEKANHHRYLTDGRNVFVYIYAYFTIYINERLTVVCPSLNTSRVDESILHHHATSLLYGLKVTEYVILLQTLTIAPAEGIAVVTLQQFGQRYEILRATTRIEAGRCIVFTMWVTIHGETPRDWS